MASVFFIKVNLVEVAVAHRDQFLSIKEPEWPDIIHFCAADVGNASSEEPFEESIGHDYTADSRLRVIRHGMPTLLWCDRCVAVHIADVVVGG